MIPLRSIRPFSDIVDDLAFGFVEGYFGEPLSAQSSTLRNYKVVNTDEFDLVPKKTKIEKDIKEKEEKIKVLKQRKDNEQKWFDEQIKSLETELGNLRTKLQ